MCICDDPYEEEFPEGAEECEPSVCMERYLQAWDDEFDDEICVCEKIVPSYDSSWPSMSLLSIGEHLYRL